MRTAPSKPASTAPQASPLQFLPLELASTGAAQGTAVACDQALPVSEPAIQVELHRGSMQLTVRWPAAHADACAARLRELANRGVQAVIRIDVLWLCTQPVDMCAGAERLLAAVVTTLGQARAHHGYLFANARATRIKLLVHDGFGVWCAARRQSAGRFVWLAATPGSAPALQLTRAQFDALVLGLRRTPAWSGVFTAAEMSER